MKQIILGKYKGNDAVTDTSELFNGHIGIIGGSGGGKTVKSQDIMVQIAKSGGTVIAYDLHGALSDDQIFAPYKQAFEEVLNSIDAYRDGIPFDLFTPIKYADGTEEDELDTVGAIVDMIARPTNLGVRQKADLRRAVTDVMQTNAYETYGFKAIDDALAKIGTQHASGVREKINALTIHNIFRPGNSFIEQGKINVIRLSRYDVDTQIIIAEAVSALIWRMANVDSFKKDNIYLFIDECQNMPSSKDSMLAQMLSEGRRFGVNLIVATQLLLDSSFNAVQQRFTQCGLMLFFKPLGNRVDQTSKMIDPAAKSDWTIVLRSLKRGEFIATGSFVVNGHKSDRPLKIDGRVTETRGEENIELHADMENARGTVEMPEGFFHK